MGKGGQAVWRAHRRQTITKVRGIPPPFHSFMHELVHALVWRRKRRRNNIIQSIFQAFLSRYVSSILIAIMEPDTVIFLRRLCNHEFKGLCKILYPEIPIKQPIRPCFRDPSARPVQKVSWVLSSYVIVSFIVIMELITESILCLLYKHARRGWSETLSRVIHIKHSEMPYYRNPSLLPAQNASLFLFWHELVIIIDNMKSTAVSFLSLLHKHARMGFSKILYLVFPITQSLWSCLWDHCLLFVKGEPSGNNHQNQGFQLQGCRVTRNFLHTRKYTICSTNQYSQDQSGIKVDIRNCIVHGDYIIKLCPIFVERWRPCLLQDLNPRLFIRHLHPIKHIDYNHISNDVAHRVNQITNLNVLWNLKPRDGLHYPTQSPKVHTEVLSDKLQSLIFRVKSHTL